MKFFTKEAENLCNKLIDNANALMFYLDNKGVISMCNKKAENLTGLSRKDILGKGVGNLRCLARGTGTI